MYFTRNLPNTRIDVADALRGIAVAGIILYHSVEHFDIFTKEPIVHTLPCDQQVGSVLAWLLSGKMYGIFAILSTAIHHRQFHLLWLWTGLLSSAGHHLRRDGRRGHGYRSIYLWPLLV